jgi:hypothetical protein
MTRTPSSLAASLTLLAAALSACDDDAVATDAAAADVPAATDVPVATDVPAATDVPVAPVDRPAATDAPLACGDVGVVTLAVPPTAQSATSNFNVTPNACTRTALALQCELGVAHQYEVVVEGAVRRIRANGIPNHDVGPFPGPGNPNTIAPQVYAYAVPVAPSGAGAAARVFGITLSGAVLDPGTAELWNDNRAWNYEALRYATAPAYFSGAGATDTTFHPTSLGVDCNFAHVQPNGAYHYHGIPTGLMPAAPALTFVGWAGDGYPIFGRWDRSVPADAASPLAEMRASYRLRTGTRPSGTAGPGGSYDGTFVQDWEYVAGLGDLDECNGRTGVVTFDGRTASTYHYVLTNTWPYIPRCFHAAPDASFSAGAMMMPGGDAGVVADAGAMGPAACTSTAGCAGLCPAGSRGCTCATTPMGMRCVPTCSVVADCPMAPPGVTFSCRSGICAP